jgi:ligand-binding sensor domain-containing protein
MEQYTNIKELNTHICNFAILLLFFVLSLPANSQSDINSVKVKTEGLSSNSITCIYQDRQEYIWIGTQHGLNRFDSYWTKSFFHIPGDTGSLSNSSITCIAEDADSNLWIGTRNGINRYNRKNNSFQQYLLYEGRIKIPMNNYIVDLYCDENKNFWILSKQFLYKLVRNNNKTILKQYDFSKHKNDTSKTYNYNTITSDNYKNIWLIMVARAWTN